MVRRCGLLPDKEVNIHCFDIWTKARQHLGFSIGKLRPGSDENDVIYASCVLDQVKHF